MNVVHVFPYTPKTSGGHTNAARGFIACQQAMGIEASGIAPRADEFPAPQAWGFPLLEVDSLWELRWKSIADWLQIPAQETILNFYSINFRFGPFLKDLRREHVPYVVTEQGQLSFQNPARWLKKFTYLNFVDWGPRRAAGLHVLTRFAAERLKYLVPGYRGQVLVQGNLANVPDVTKIKAASRSEYGLPRDAFVLLFLGRIDVWVKGLDRVVEAFARLPPKFRLVLAGPDWQDGRATLEALAGKLGCKDRLHFIGPVYGDTKWSVLRMADAFVSPSRKEGFGIALAEALACGLPVLSSTKISLALELKEAEAALLVPVAAAPLAEAMQRLEADARLRADLARRGRSWFEATCNPAAAGRRFREFYQAILKQQ